MQKTADMEEGVAKNMEKIVNVFYEPSHTDKNIFDNSY